MFPGRMTLLLLVDGITLTLPVGLASSTSTFEALSLGVARAGVSAAFFALQALSNSIANMKLCVTQRTHNAG
jgi:hypothetical protein